MKIKRFLPVFLLYVLSFEAASQGIVSLFQVELFANENWLQLLNFKSLQRGCPEVYDPLLDLDERSERERTEEKPKEAEVVSTKPKNKSIQELCVDWWEMSDSLSDMKLQELQEHVFELRKVLTSIAVEKASEQRETCEGAIAEDNNAMVNAFFLGSLSMLYKRLGVMRDVSINSFHQPDASVIHAAGNLHLARLFPESHKLTVVESIKYGPHTFYLPGRPFTNALTTIKYIQSLLSVICEYSDSDSQKKRSFSDHPTILMLFKHMGYGDSSEGVFTVKTGMSLGKEVYPVRLIKYFINSLPASHPMAAVLHGIRFDREVRSYTTTADMQKKHELDFRKAFENLLESACSEEKVTNAQTKIASVQKKKKEKKTSNTSGLVVGRQNKGQEPAVKIFRDTPPSYAKRAKELMKAQKIADLKEMLINDWSGFISLKPNQKKEIREYIKKGDNAFYHNYKRRLED